MYCTCENPKKTKNSANGQTFYVCAKSKGGCGLEYGGIWTSNPVSAQGGSLTPEMVEEACIRALGAHIGLDMGGKDKTVVGQINPHMKTALWCPCCSGIGHTKTTLHNGLTKEEPCGYCEGAGEIEL